MGVTQRQTQQLQPRLLREWVPGSSLLQKPIQTFSSSKSTPPKLHEEQDGRVKDQAELPRGLRGVDQQADQHGILCLVRLSFYEFLVQPGRSSPPRICCSFQERVWGGTRPWHEADGIPDKVAGDKGDGHLCDFLESEYLNEQVEGIKAIGDLITKMKRAGDGLGLHLIDKEMGS